jgi:hypothetical protein
MARFVGELEMKVVYRRPTLGELTLKLTLAHGGMADLEDEEQSELTFGTLHTPSLEHQHAAQKKPPKMTPLPKRVSKLRRIPGGHPPLRLMLA